MSELKPCPFCGGEATINESDDLTFTSAMCDSCGAGIARLGLVSQNDNEARLVEAWNRRESQNG